MKIPENLFYTKEHEWALIEGNKCKMGITDYAQSHLGDVTYVELPAGGKEIKQFEALAQIESVKASSDIYAPLSCKVIEVNGTLSSSPERINKSPYGEGWIAVAEVKDESEKNKLMDSQKYKEYLESIKE